MRLVILQYHIFKNAGSTIEDILDHSFGGRFARLETPVDEGLITNRDLLSVLDSRPDLCALSSHQIRHPLPQMPGHLFFDICFLRDPIDRIRSIYTYFRQKPAPGNPMSNLANCTELGDFVAGMIRDLPLFVKNVQVNLLACAGDSDEPETRDLDVAVQRMLATSFLGVVDCFDQSLAAGAYALRPAFPELDCDRPAVNVSDGMQGTVASRTLKLRQACRPDVFDELLRLTELDRQLVDRARAEVLRRFRQIPQRRLRLGTREKRPAQPSAAFFMTAGRLVRLAPFWRELSGSARKTLFDREYYRTSSPDAKAGRRFPLLHFLVQGAFQGRQPHPLFDPAFYLRKYPDVVAAGVNPLCHYLKYGAAELRQPHPLFDPTFYLARIPDLRGAKMNPLAHYVRQWAADDRKPFALFEPSYYRITCPEARAGSQNLLEHFLGSGIAAASPHPLFDCEAYLDAHPEVAAPGGNPLVHYMLSDVGRPTSEIADKPPGIESASVVHIDIQDVRVIVIYLTECLDSTTMNEQRTAHERWKIWAAHEGMAGNVALVWADDCGLAHCIAEPQQQRFLDAVRLDQIRAQLRPFPSA